MILACSRISFSFFISRSPAASKHGSVRFLRFFVSRAANGGRRGGIVAPSFIDVVSHGTQQRASNNEIIRLDRSYGKSAVYIRTHNNSWDGSVFRFFNPFFYQAVNNKSQPAITTIRNGLNNEVTRVAQELRRMHSSFDLVIGFPCSF